MKKNKVTPKSAHHSPKQPAPDMSYSIPGEDRHITNAEEDWRDDEDYEPRRGIYKIFNVHVLFLLLLVFAVFIIFVRIKNWGVWVDLDEIFKDENDTQYTNNFDTVMPLLDENFQIVHPKKPATILAFGNAPFADDRHSEDNLANLIAKETGATVYNCSIGDSYLASGNGDLDIFTFYWLVHLAAGDKVDKNFAHAKETLGDAYPEDADEAVEILSNIDLDDVDVITIMYDATDYLLGHNMYSDENSSDINQFTGNMEAGIELLKADYPHIRIIVMSPTYAYAVDEKGNYVGSEKYIYNNQSTLSTYALKQCSSCIVQGVSFVDNLYNTITDANADDYLIDNLHINVEGRKLLAKRFASFFNYYE